MTRFRFFVWNFLIIGTSYSVHSAADPCSTPSSSFNYLGTNARIGGEQWTDSIVSPSGELWTVSTPQLSVSKLDAKGMELMRFSLPDQHLRPVQIAMQPSGRILVGGIHTLPARNGRLLYKIQILGFDHNGQLDKNFGNAGIFEYPSISGFLSLAVRCDGAIVVAFDHAYKTLFNNLRYEFATLRLTENGRLDRSYGANGTSALRIGKLWNSPESLLLGLDGSILVGGQSHLKNQWQSLIFNLSPNGARVHQFGENGISQIYSFTNTGSIRSMVQLPNGKIAATGMNTSSNHVSIAKLNPNGSLDQSFGSNGIAYDETPSIEGETLFFTANSIAATADESFLVGGNLSSQSQSQNYYLVTKFDATGILDRSFGTQGHVAIPLPNSKSGGELIGFENGSFVVISDGRQTISASVHRFDGFGQLVSDFEPVE